MRCSFCAVLRALAVTCGLSACEAAGPDTSRQLASVVVRPDSRVFTALGDSARLVAVARNPSGAPISGIAFAWSSLDGDVASVDQSGMVKALKVGSARVVASVSGMADTATITVSQTASRVVISPEADTINAVGDTVALAVAVFDANEFAIPNPVVTWHATAPSVVAVGQGRVVSLTTGTVRVIATVDATADTAQVLSRQIAATLEIVHPLPALVIGESFQVPARAADSNGVAIPLSGLGWMSAAPSVVSVSSAGVMRGESVGSTTITISAPPRAVDVRVRVLQPLDSIGERIGVGSFHSCALNVAGEAYCWGSFSPTWEPRTPWPTRLEGGHIFRTIAADSWSACALTPDGDAYCWGMNGWRQLGDGTSEDRNAPVRVLGAPRFASITVGYFHACGLTAEGAAYCWGRQPNVLGDSPGDSVATPVAPGMVFRNISAGYFYTCGVTTTDMAYCWGYNLEGNLGDGTTDSKSVPTPVAGNLRFADVTAGDRHTCGLTTDGVAYCWGNNDRGQLGDGTQFDRRVPVRVAGGHTFATIDAGEHTCGVTTLGAGYCWGFNHYGQLGNGQTGPEECVFVYPGCATTPQRVSGGLAFARILPSRIAHTCGRTVQGAIYCWGYNLAGQVGNGRQSDPPGRQEDDPVRVHLP